MSLFDRFLPDRDAQSNGDAEHLGPDDPAPRGESRETGDEGFLISATGGLYPYNRGRVQSPGTEIVTERSSPPDVLADSDDYERWSHHPIVRASLQTFSDTVLEPGWQVEATRNGEPDEEMAEALSMWGSNCAIHAGETGKDVRYILDRVIRARRAKGTLFMEPAGTREDPTALRALILHKPETFKQYHRADTALLVQPDDPVDEGHPMVPPLDGGDPLPAAYVQYDDDLSSWSDTDEIPFTFDQLVKFVYDVDEGEIWGTSIFESIGERIDALEQKLDDRDMAIHQTGHPHRIYSSETWTQDQATDYAEAHEDGDVSAHPDTSDEGTFAGRVDFVPATVDITTETGEVADIDDAVMDDLQHIFAVLPVSRFKVAYEEDINQFVVEPQQETDDRLVDEERLYLRQEFEPLFERKADELASGDEYGGEVNWRIEPQPDENPIRREDFPAENLESVGSFLRAYYSAGATADFPPEFAAMLMGVDLDEMEDRLGFDTEALAASLTASEETDAARDQLRALEDAPGVEDVDGADE